MVTCAECGKIIHLAEPVSAVFTTERKRSFFHKDCEEGNQPIARWKEEAPWAFRPTRLTLPEWSECSARKHLGLWQSIFIARRDEDIHCPDCGLKIARHENLACPSCTGSAVILNAEPSRMVFTHGEPLYKLLLHCTEKGEETSTYAVTTGYTPVTLTAKKRATGAVESRNEVMMLKYQPKGDLKQGLRV